MPISPSKIIARSLASATPVLEFAEHLGFQRARFVDAELQHLSGCIAMSKQSKAEARRAAVPKLIHNCDLRAVAVDRLKTGWTPEQIAGRLRLACSEIQVSHETIYWSAYSKDGHAIDLWCHRPEHGRRRRGRGNRRTPAEGFRDRVLVEAATLP